MNIDHLRYFSDAVELSSLAKSAKVNHVSPGAISQAIQKLEQSLNQKLLIHRKKNFEPTNTGHQLYKDGQSLLRDYQLLKNKYLSSNSLEEEFLFITQQSIAESFLAKPLTNFVKKYNQITPKMTLGHTTIAKDRLKERSVDFAILLDNVDLVGCNQITIHEGSFVFYQPIKKNKRQFLTTGNTPEVKYFKKIFHDKFLKEPDILMEISSWGVLKRLAKEGQGIALLPDYILTTNEYKSIVKNNFGLKLNSYKIIAAWPSTKPPSNTSMNFINSLIKK